jgi:hypothetical protein
MTFVKKILKYCENAMLEKNSNSIFLKIFMLKKSLPVLHSLGKKTVFAKPFIRPLPSPPPIGQFLGTRYTK